MLGSYINPGWIERDRPKEIPCKTKTSRTPAPFPVYP